VLGLAIGLTFWLLRGAANAAIDSVAVLPFATSGTGTAADSEYLTDGITESLINGLSQLPGLRVTARSVVFRYKGRDIDPQQVGRELNVKTVVTGRVSLRGERLVIQADLMNVEDGTQLWGNQYNRASADLLDVQDNIAREILDKLRPRLSGEEMKLATRRYTDDAEAYQLYLQGRYHWNKGTIAGYKKAIEYFQQAIAKDEKYARAYAGLADSHLLLGSYYVEALPDAKAAAEQALKLDSSLAEAHVALGHIKLWLDWDWPAAERAFKQGIALGPASALAHNQYAMYLATLGKTSEAIAEARRALDLDPLSPIVNSDLGWHLLYAGKPTDAIAQFRKTLEFDANSVSAHEGLGIAFSEEGLHDDAIAELRRALQLAENSPAVMGHLGAAYVRQRNKAAADALLKDLQTLSAREYVPSSALAVIYAAQGDKTRALEMLERAYAEHDFSMAQIGVAPWFKSLRGEERFRNLLAKLALPQRN
jgi:eukaryotic-like serine/threonine-protein kinase